MLKGRMAEANGRFPGIGSILREKTPAPYRRAVAHTILLIRGQRVMLDRDLALLYGVRTKDLNKAVKRNRLRFPPDFMFRLTRGEAADLRFQSGTSSSEHGGRRYAPFAFTEQGVAMLSGVLKSRRAVLANVAIMRAFVHLRQTLALHSELASKLEDLERRIATHDEQIRSVFDAIRGLMEPVEKPLRRIGFRPAGEGDG